MELRWEAKLYNWHLHLGKEDKNTKAALLTSGNIKIHSWTLWPEHTSNWNSKDKAMQFCTKHPVLGNADKLSPAHQVFQIPLSASGWGSELKIPLFFFFLISVVGLYGACVFPSLTFWKGRRQAEIKCLGERPAFCDSNGASWDTSVKRAPVTTVLAARCAREHKGCSKK